MSTPTSSHIAPGIRDTNSPFFVIASMSGRIVTPISARYVRNKGEFFLCLGFRSPAYLNRFIRTAIGTGKYVSFVSDPRSAPSPTPVCQKETVARIYRNDSESSELLIKVSDKMLGAALNILFAIFPSQSEEITRCVKEKLQVC